MARDTGGAHEILLDEHGALMRELARAIVRLSKRVKAVNLDLAKIAEAESLARLAPWIVPAAAKARRGAKSLAFSDWSSGEAKNIEIPLDPAKSPKEQVDAMFARARRLRAGRPIAERRRDEASVLADELRALHGELAAIDPDSPDLEARIESLYERAKKVAPKEIRGDAQAPVAKRKLQERAPPFRTFIGRGDTKILVGRGADRNDELTFDVARPHHAWLHAKGEAGAHVVVCVKKGAELTQDELVDAAHLAAHFSKARGETLVDVSYTYRRYVRKPRKSPPGTVVVDREKVITVRMEPARIETLLATEQA